MAPKFALFTKGSKLPLNKGFKNMFELYSLALNPRYTVSTLTLKQSCESSANNFKMSSSAFVIDYLNVNGPSIS